MWSRYNSHLLVASPAASDCIDSIIWWLIAPASFGSALRGVACSLSQRNTLIFALIRVCAANWRVWHLRLWYTQLSTIYLPALVEQSFSKEIFLCYITWLYPCGNGKSNCIKSRYHNHVATDITFKCKLVSVSLLLNLGRSYRILNNVRQISYGANEMKSPIWFLCLKYWSKAKH